MRLSRAEHEDVARYAERLRPTRQCMRMLKGAFPNSRILTSTRASACSYNEEQAGSAATVGAHCRPVVDLSPALMARIILDRYLQDLEGAVLSVRIESARAAEEGAITALLLCALEQLHLHITRLAAVRVPGSGAIGQEHEVLLCDRLKERNLSFLGDPWLWEPWVREAKVALGFDLPSEGPRSPEGGGSEGSEEVH
ncbi:unnamed protein product [Merluccius merluccius]